MGHRRATLMLLLLPLLAMACGGQAATNTPGPPPGGTATIAATTAATPAATAVVGTPTAAIPVAATASRVSTATVGSTPTNTPTVVVATASRTATRVGGAATPGSPVTTPGSPTATGQATRAPSGVAPVGWSIYRGNAKAPFAMYYPPDWTVDESRMNEGRVYFFGPGVSEPFEDVQWVLVATTGRPEPSGNIDVLRDQYFSTEIRGPHPEAGIDITRNNVFSGVTFASLGSTFDAGGQLCYAYIGLGLDNGVPWRFRLNSLYGDYSRNLDSTFAPMINSLNIYANP